MSIIIGNTVIIVYTMFYNILFLMLMQNYIFLIIYIVKIL